MADAGICRVSARQRYEDDSFTDDIISSFVTFVYQGTFMLQYFRPHNRYALCQLCFENVLTTIN